MQLGPHAPLGHQARRPLRDKVGGGDLPVRQAEPGRGERVHQGPGGHQDPEGPEDPRYFLRGQHRRPARAVHGILPSLNLRGKSRK